MTDNSNPTRGETDATPPGEAPVLAYAPPTARGKSPSQTIRELLAVEWVVLLLCLLILDGGFLLRVASLSFLIGWAVMGASLRKRSYSPTRDDRIVFVLGVATAFAAPLL